MSSIIVFSEGKWHKPRKRKVGFSGVDSFIIAWPSNWLLKLNSQCEIRSYRTQLLHCWPPAAQGAQATAWIRRWKRLGEEARQGKHGWGAWKLCLGSVLKVVGPLRGFPAQGEKIKLFLWKDSSAAEFRKAPQQWASNCREQTRGYWSKPGERWEWRTGGRDRKGQCELPSAYDSVSCPQVSSGL